MSEKNNNQIVLFLDGNLLVETFEALCSLPFTHSCIGDCEPSTKREPGIEQLIEQLEESYRRKTEL